MSARVTRTALARLDLLEIWLYIAEHDIPSADRIEHDIREAIKLLAERPEIGHSRRDLTDRPVKFWTVNDYMIVFDPATHPVQIIRVLHGRRDIPELL